MRDPLEAAKLDPRRTLVWVSLVVAGGAGLAIVNPTAVGTVAVILGIFLMIMIHEAGHYITAKWSDMKVTEFFLGFGPRLWSVRKGETDYGVKAIPAGGYVRIIGMNNLEEVEPQDEARAYRSKPYRNKLMVAVAGSFTHFVMAIGLLFFIFVFLGTPEAVPVIDEIIPDAPAAAAGFELGDRIVAVDGESVATWDEVPDLVQPRGGQPIVVTVERSGRIIDLPVTPAAREVDGGGSAGFLGVGPTVEDVTRGPATAVKDSFTGTFDIAKESVAAMGRFFTPSNLSRYGDALTGKAKPADDSRFLSPVGATQVASDAVEAGLAEVLLFLALINIFVGTFNMFPLPPLDGGHVAIATYEKIASSIKGEEVRVDMAKIMPVAALVVIVFVFIGVSALWLDIFQPVDVGF